MNRAFRRRKAWGYLRAGALLHLKGLWHSAFHVVLLLKYRHIDMAEIDGVTLRMAIQAVDAMINDLAKQLEADDSTEAEELELRLLKYEGALEKLKVGYEEEQKISGNLPPFEKLVGE